MEKIRCGCNDGATWAVTLEQAGDDWEGLKTPDGRKMVKIECLDCGGSARREVRLQDAIEALYNAAEQLRRMAARAKG